jgi:hypothetical protein
MRNRLVVAVVVVVECDCVCDRNTRGNCVCGAFPYTLYLKQEVFICSQISVKILVGMTASKYHMTLVRRMTVGTVILTRIGPVRRTTVNARKSRLQ